MPTILSVVGFLFTFILSVNCQFRFDYSFNAKVGGWLKLHILPANFHDAFRKCEAEGAVLASPLNIYLKNAMVSLHKKSVNENCGLYTGIHSTVTKGAFASVEGKPLTKIPVEWAPNEPDNYNDTEDCIVMLQNGTMADVRCTETFPYICYKKKTVNMVLNECGTIDNGYQLDSRTGSCYKFHTIGRTWKRAYMVCMAEGGHLAIVNSETEAQVLKDLFAKYPAEKIFSRWKDGASIGFHDWGETGVWYTVHEYYLDSRTDSCYKFHYVGRTWRQAFMICMAEGGHLAIINSDTEMQVIKELFAKFSHEKIFSQSKDVASIGFHDWGESGYWYTVHGQRLHESGYSKFANGQPDNDKTFDSSGSSCGGVFRDGLLDDLWCTGHLLPFICEKKPDSLIVESD